MCETADDGRREEDFQVHGSEGGYSHFFQHVQEIESRLVVENSEGVEYEDNVEEPHIVPQIVEMLMPFEVFESVKDIHQEED